MKAIETIYKGYRFRSRLEARWAVGFDAMRIAWTYESEGYEKQFSNGRMERYLPDFYLPETKTWVEVKGEMTPAEALRLAEFLDYGCPLPHVDDSYDPPNEWPQSCPGLLVLGDIPDPDCGLTLHRLVTHGKALHPGWAYFTPPGHGNVPGRLKRAPRDFLEGLRWATAEPRLNVSHGFDGLCIDESEAVHLFSPRALSLRTELCFPEVQSAYRAARSARFEHGETPTPPSSPKLPEYVAAILPPVPPPLPPPAICDFAAFMQRMAPIFAADQAGAMARMQTVLAPLGLKSPAQLALLPDLIVQVEMGFHAARDTVPPTTNSA